MLRQGFPALRKRRTIVTFHSLGDLDAVGAAIAFQRFLGPKCVIAPPDQPNSSARRLLKQTGTPTTPFQELALSKSDAVVVLDSSSASLLFHLVGVVPDVLIDHHVKLGGEIQSKNEIRDPSASSVCEMLYFILDPKDKVSCFALLAGLVSDSSRFKYATPRTFEAASALLSRCGAGYPEVLSLGGAPESLEERIESLRSCPTVSAEKVGEHVIATAMAKSHEAHFAEALLFLGADVSFVACRGRDGRISGRMRDSMLGKVRLERIMFEAGKLLGGNGGGHELSAGASGSGENVRAALGLCAKLAEQQVLSTEKSKIHKIEW